MDSSTHSQRERATFKSSSDSIKSLKNQLKWCILITKNFQVWTYCFIFIKYLNYISIILNLIDSRRNYDLEKRDSYRILAGLDSWNQYNYYLLVWFNSNFYFSFSSSSLWMSTVAFIKDSNLIYKFKLRN